MKRNGFLSIFGVLTLSLLASCSNNGTNNENKFVIGMECAYQPFNWTINSSNEFSLPIFGTSQYADGYDIQIARYLSKELNKEVVIKKIEWDSLIPSLVNNEINAVLAGMSVTQERLKTIDFTDPYLSSDLAFLIKTENLPEGNSKENPASYEELKALFSNQNLVCQANVVGDDIIDTYFASVDGLNVHHNQPLATYPLAALDVKSGAAFAMPAELPVIEAMTNLGGLSVLYCDYESFLSEDDIIGLSVNIGIKKGNETLKNELNGALAKLSEEERGRLMGEASVRSAQNA